MPVLTVRSFAEMINLPMYSQYKILHEQKYPKDESNVFKVPFYKPSIDIIKKYFKYNKDKTIIENWIKTEVERIKPQSKSINNKRVVSKFISSPISTRNLTLINRNYSYTAYPLEKVELKLHFDIEGSENGQPIFIFINFRGTKIDEQIAKDTLSLTYWILEKNGINCKISQLEYIDLAADIVFRVKKQSISTIKKMNNNALVVKTLWDSI